MPCNRVLDDVPHDPEGRPPLIAAWLPGLIDNQDQLPPIRVFGVRCAERATDSQIVWRRHHSLADGPDSREADLPRHVECRLFVSCVPGAWPQRGSKVRATQALYPCLSDSHVRYIVRCSSQARQLKAEALASARVTDGGFCRRYSRRYGSRSKYSLRRATSKTHRAERSRSISNTLSRSTL